MASTLTYLDSYCERAGDPALWAEPLNAITNIFFIVAAFLAAVALYKKSAPVKSVCDLWLLSLALFAIGIGSGLWHLMPSASTVLMDVIPITLFIHLYLVTTMRRLLRLRWCAVFFWWSLYVGLSIAAQLLLPPDLFNGTVMYLPTYVTLLLLTGAVYYHERKSGVFFTKMLALWTVSLVFRTVDHEVCGQFSSGTHFLWHTLNAAMLYCFLRFMIRRAM